MRRKIFIVNYGNHKLNSALHYTSLLPEKAFIRLSEGTINIFKIDRILYDFTKKLKDSKPEDLVILSGSIPLNIIAITILLEKHNIANMLIFNNLKQDYTLRTISKSEVRRCVLDENQ